VQDFGSSPRLASVSSYIAPAGERAPMNKQTKVIFLVILLTTISSARAQSSWKTYVNKEYGYSIPIPSDLRLAPWKGDPESPWRNRSKTFQSKDEKVSLSIVTHWTNGRTLRDFFNDEVSDRKKGGDRINYSTIKNDWCVISGTNTLGFEFYSKWFVFTDEATKTPRYITFDFAYPASQRASYDPAVMKIAREFVPDMKGEYPRD
jgi:hypothetical protein